MPDLDTTNAADRVYMRSQLGIAADSRFGRRGGIVADNTNRLGGSSFTVVTANVFSTHRTRHVNRTGKVITSLTLGYSNYGPLAGTEAATPNAITVKATIELEGTPTDQAKPRTPVYFAGAISASVPPRGVVYSDPVQCWIAPGAAFYIRSGATVTVDGQAFPRGNCTLGGTASFGQDNGEGAAAADRVNDAGAVITPFAATATYSPSIILGTLVDGSIAPSVAIIGDSIAAGIDDAAMGNGIGGWVKRAFAEYPSIYVPIPGETLFQAVDGKNFYARFELASQATTVVSEYLRNDVEQGQTLAQIKANTLAFALKFMRRGQRFVQATCLPAPTSTDGYFTVANQTPQSSDKESVRVAANAWLRDASASGFVAQAMAQVATIPLAGDAKVIDPCAGIEVNAAGALTLDGGRVKADQPGGVLATGTATSATTTSVTNTGAAFTVNAFKGKALYIVSGTGAGQSRCIGYNSSTQINVLNAFSPAPDATSVYQVFESTMNGVHPTSALMALAAASITPASVVI